MPFAPVELFAAIKAALAASFGSFDQLAVDGDCRWFWLTPLRFGGDHGLPARGYRLCYPASHHAHTACARSPSPSASSVRAAALASLLFRGLSIPCMHRPIWFREMAFVNVKAATFVIGKHAFNPEPQPIPLCGFIRIGQGRYQIHGLVLIRVPDAEQQHRAIPFGRHLDVHDSDCRAALEQQITNREDPIMGVNRTVGSGATDLRPSCGADGGLQLRAVKLASAEQQHLGGVGDDRLESRDQIAMLILRQVPLFALDHRPEQRDRASVIDDARHQDHAAASGSRAIQDDRHGRLRQTGQNGLRKRQPNGLRRGGFVFDPAAKAGDQAFILATMQRRVIGNLRELDVLRANNAADQPGQCIQVLFLMAPRTGMQRLRQCPFDGTIVLESHVHVILLSACLVIIATEYHAHGFLVRPIQLRSPHD